MMATPGTRREICRVNSAKRGMIPTQFGGGYVTLSSSYSGKCVADACCHLASTMTFTSTSNSSSVFQDGKVKSGIYKIYNIFHEAYLDIHEHPAREMYLRPAQDLGEGRGLVRRYHLPVTRIVYLTIGSGKSNPLELVI